MNTYWYDEYREMENCIEDEESYRARVLERLSRIADLLEYIVEEIPQFEKKEKTK
jgi:hypothetical protein